MCLRGKYLGLCGALFVYRFLCSLRHSRLRKTRSTAGASSSTGQSRVGLFCASLLTHITVHIVFRESVTCVCGGEVRVRVCLCRCVCECVYACMRLSVRVGI